MQSYCTVRIILFSRHSGRSSRPFATVATAFGFEKAEELPSPAGAGQAPEKR